MKQHKMETLIDLIWIVFGAIAGIDYFSKEDFFAAGLLIALSVVYTFKILKKIINPEKN